MERTESTTTVEQATPASDFGPHPAEGMAAGSRRHFLRATPVAAAGAALVAAKLGSTTAVAGQSERSDDVNAAHDQAAHLDVRAFGARGDGQADDTAALRRAIAEAKSRAIGTVFLPAGVYLISKTLQLPSHVALHGASPGLTTLRATPDTLFEKFRPNPRTAEIRQRRTMLTTEAVGSVREQVTRHAAVRALTVDWNHCPTQEYGHSVVLADSCDDFVMQDVRFVRCLPGDHPRSRDEMGGPRFRCECVMYSNARHGLMHRCELTDSGYRPLSVAYNSRQIHFINGRIIAEQPVWRHVFCENHTDGMPMDDTFRHSQIIMLDSTFVLQGGTGNDGICSHTGTTHVENCDFYLNGGMDPRHFRSVLKPFDHSVDCTYVNNRFHCERVLDQGPVPILNTYNTGQRGPNQRIIFAHSLVDLHYDLAPWRDQGYPGHRDRPCLAWCHHEADDEHVSILHNHARLRFRNYGGAKIITLSDARAVRCMGNSVHVQIDQEQDGPAEERPDALLVERCRSVSLRDNVFTGPYRDGIRVADTCERAVVAGNDVAEAHGEAVAGADEERQVIVDHNLV